MALGSRSARFGHSKSRTAPFETFVIYMKDIGFSFYMKFCMPIGHLLCKPYKFGQVLEDDAVRFDGLQVPRRHGCECIPYSGDGDVLRGHHEVVHGPAAPIGQQLGHVDVIPVHPTRGVQEQLPVLAPVRSRRTGGCWCAWCR